MSVSVCLSVNGYGASSVFCDCLMPDCLMPLFSSAKFCQLSLALAYCTWYLEHITTAVCMRIDARCLPSICCCTRLVLHSVGFACCAACCMLYDFTYYLP